MMAACLLPAFSVAKAEGTGDTRLGHHPEEKERQRYVDEEGHHVPYPEACVVEQGLVHDNRLAGQTAHRLPSPGTESPTNGMIAKTAVASAKHTVRSARTMITPSRQTPA